jgi:hypothetical protein
MATSSILGGQPAPRKARGRDADALGPSDSSDSGSDVQGERAMPTLPDNAGEIGAVPIDTDSDTDALGTGERASATGDLTREGADILPDRVGASGDTTPTRDLETLADDEDETGTDETGDDEASPSTSASPPAPKKTRRARR